MFLRASVSRPRVFKGFVRPERPHLRNLRFTAGCTELRGQVLVGQGQGRPGRLPACKSTNPTQPNRNETKQIKPTRQNHDQLGARDSYGWEGAPCMMDLLVSCKLPCAPRLPAKPARVPKRRARSRSPSSHRQGPGAQRVARDQPPEKVEGPIISK